ncbi:hypothetical protein T484DRAFT_1883998, partial [Baffinella frigidus]
MPRMAQGVAGLASLAAALCLIVALSSLTTPSTELMPFEAPLSSSSAFLSDSAIQAIGSGDPGEEDLQEAEEELAAAKRAAAIAKVSEANATLKRAEQRQKALRNRERVTAEEVHAWRRRQEGKAGMKTAASGTGLGALFGTGGDIHVVSAASKPQEQQPLWTSRPRLSRPGGLPSGWFMGSVALTGRQWRAKIGGAILKANKLTAKRVARLSRARGEAAAQAKDDSEAQEAVQRVIRKGMAGTLSGGAGGAAGSEAGPAEADSE